MLKTVFFLCSVSIAGPALAQSPAPTFAPSDPVALALAQQVANAVNAGEAKQLASLAPPAEVAACEAEERMARLLESIKKKFGDKLEINRAEIKIEKDSKVEAGADKFGCKFVGAAEVAELRIFVKPGKRIMLVVAKKAGEGWYLLPGKQREQK